MKTIFGPLWAAFCLCLLWTIPLTAGDDADAGYVSRPIIGACESGNCTDATVNISNKTIQRTMFITAKGPNGSITAGNISGGQLCGLQPGDVVVKGKQGAIEPSDLSYTKIGDVEFRAGKEIRLVNGFRAERGCRFQGYIEPDWNYERPVWSEYFDYEPLPFDYDNPQTDGHAVFADRWHVRQHENRNRLEFRHIENDPGTTADDDTVFVIQTGTVAGQKKAPWWETYDYYTTSQDVRGRYDMVVRWPTVYFNTVPAIKSTHSVWLDAADGIGSIDEIDNYERNGGVKNLCDAQNPPYHCAPEAPHYFGAQMGSQHTFRTAKPFTNGFDVDPALDAMPSFDDEFALISVEWQSDVIRILVNDCAIHRFPSLHTNDGGHLAMAAVLYSFAKNSLKTPAHWLAWYLWFADGLAAGDRELELSSLMVYNLKGE